MNYISGFKMVAMNPNLIGKLCDAIGNMPNVDFPTMGGHFCWDTLIIENGFKLQKNKFTNHIRILDNDNIRRAWGGEKKMKEVLSSFV